MKYEVRIHGSKKVIAIDVEEELQPHQLLVVKQKVAPPVQKCPGCDSVLQDFRRTAFSAKAMRADGTCYRWSLTEYTCNGLRKNVPSAG